MIFFQIARQKSSRLTSKGSRATSCAAGQDLLTNPKLKALIVEVWEGANRSASSQLAAVGFVPARYEPFKRRLELTSSRTGGNIVFVRDRDWVAERVASAPKLAVKGLAV